MKLTKEQIEIIHHTYFRTANHMFCGDSPDMQILVEQGMMKPCGSKSFVSDGFFVLTKKGKDWLSDYMCGVLPVEDTSKQSSDEFVLKLSKNEAEWLRTYLQNFMQEGEESVECKDMRREIFDRLTPICRNEQGVFAHIGLNDATKRWSRPVMSALFEGGSDNEI